MEIQSKFSIDPTSFSEKGPEGKVVTILSRGRTHMAGVIQRIDKPMEKSLPMFPY